MPGDAHSYLQNRHLNLQNLHYLHGPGSWTLQEKENVKESNGPVHGPPLQARVAAANGTVLQLANCWPCLKIKPPALTNGDPGAHGMNRGKQNTMDGAKQTERGQDVDGQWGWQAKMAAGKHKAC